MLVKEYELYKSVYCSLCRKMRKRYGILSVGFLSYDVTFFCMIASGVFDLKPCVEKKSCVVNPFKKCNYCNKLDKALDLGADLSVLSFYYKLLDDLADEKFFRKAVCLLIMPYAKHIRKKASTKNPVFDDIISNVPSMQKIAEKDYTDSIDRCAHPSALMLENIMKTLAQNAEERKKYADFGYALGRWIYMADAFDDLEKDIKKKKFNPFINIFKLKSADQIYDVREKCNEILNLSATQVYETYNLINLSTFKSISDNIVKKGLGNVQKELYNKYKTGEK